MQALIYSGQTFPLFRTHQFRHSSIKHHLPVATERVHLTKLHGLCLVSPSSGLCLYVRGLNKPCKLRNGFSRQIGDRKGQTAASTGSERDALVQLEEALSEDDRWLEEKGNTYEHPENESLSFGEGEIDGKLIWRAIKLPIYTVALIPLTVGAGVAYYETGVIHVARFWIFLLFSVLVIAWLNLSNDAFDAETGVDKDKKESVVNMIGSQKGVLAVSFLCLALGVGGILLGAASVGDPRVALLLAAAIACGYVYQCPPFRLSYVGVGEPLCFFAFGPLATTAFYLVQASQGAVRAPLTLSMAAASVLVGITTTLILFCSHFHQIEGDLAVGKMSPLVRMGTQKGAVVVKAALILLYALTGASVLGGALPPACGVLAALTIPTGHTLVKFVGDNHQDTTKIFMAKYFCVRLHVSYGLYMALGLFLGSWKPFWI